MCEMGWFLELYVSKESHKYFAIEQNGGKPLTEQWEEKQMPLHAEVFFEGFDPIDKVVYAYFWN